MGRFFVEPVILSISYALNVLKYERVVMIGLSGGGWTTTMVAALDARLHLSLPIAGSMPCGFPHTSWDFEQFCDRPYVQACDYECMYALAALEDGRASVQMLHEFDPCCFAGHGRHGRIIEYNTRVQAEVQGHFETCVTSGNVHEINPRDRVVAGMLIDNLGTRGALGAADFAAMPYNVLRRWGP